LKTNYLPGLSALMCFFLLQACSSSSEPDKDDTNTSTGCTLGKGANVIVSGSVTFDRVPLKTFGGLDFNNVSQQPVRGAVVEVICNGIMAASQTDESGNYSLSLPGDTTGVFIRVKAQLSKIGTPSWNVSVSDEASATKLIFTMDGSPFDSGATNLTRNLNASSGWDGVDYTTTRVASPFAILDTIYQAMQLVLSVNPNIQFPSLDVKWNADSTNGTYYANNTIFVLGRSNDSDEFDQHVIAHEWGHYFQDVFSRDDSIGGSHGSGDILDIRVAFSEGFGNAFSAMVTGDTLYRDSQGPVDGFSFDIESNNCGSNRGWFSECSVQSALYDFYDGANDDVIDLGFSSIYTVMTENIPETTAVTSLFGFMNPYKILNPDDASNIDSLLQNSHSINPITDDVGSGRTLNPGLTNQLPLFQTSFPASICVTGENGGFNGLGVSRFMQFTVPASSNYIFTAVKVTGLASSDPDMYITSKGQLIGSGESESNNTETFSVNLVAGTVYVLEIVEFQSYSQEDYNPNGGSPNETCFAITRT